MPHLTELSAEWQNYLGKDVIRPIYTEVILDPTDKNVDLSPYLDQSGSLKIVKKKAIQPYGDVGRFTAGEVQIDLVNEDDIFNHNVKGKTFYYASSRSYAAFEDGDDHIDIIKGDGSKFSVGMEITITSNTQQLRRTLTGVDTTSYTLYDRLSFAAVSGFEFTAGSPVEIYYLPGLKVTIKSYSNNIVSQINLFKGVLKAYPALGKGKTSITLLDQFRSLLDISIRANDYRILTDSIGNYVNTIEYSRAGESTGELDLSAVNILTKCKIGTWNIRFNSPTLVTITDPDGIEINGNIMSLIGIEVEDQLLLGLGCFSGTFEPDDEISFQTTLSLGLPVNNYDSIPQMIYRLLIEEYGADLSASDINETSFTDLISEYDEMRGAISFTRPSSVLKCIELLQQHINACVFLDNDGKFTISAYRPQLDPDTIRTLSPEADIREIDQEDLGRIDRIFAYYDYNQETGQYDNLIVIPEGADQIGNRLEIYFPAYHSTDYGQAKATAERIYLTWRRGIKSYEIKEKFNYGLAFDLNEIYQISSQHPLFANRLVEIYEIEKDLLKKEVTIRAYDINYPFSNYVFVDVHNLDRGRVVW